MILTFQEIALVPTYLVRNATDSDRALLASCPPFATFKTPDGRQWQLYNAVGDGRSNWLEENT